MEFYYDMFIPFMPDSIKDEEGKFVSDEQKAAGRLAMIDLAEFQNNGTVISLYHSVINACTYAGKDLVDALLEIPNDVIIPDGMTLGEMTTGAAKLLFESIKPGNSFDVYRFCAYVLTAAHLIVSRKPEQPEPIQDDIAQESKDTEE